MWSKLAKISFEELIETLTPEQFKVFFQFIGETLCNYDYDIFRCRVQDMYIDVLAKHNTEMIKMFEDSEFIDNYWWAFRDYIIHHYDKPNLHYIMSCVKYHLKNNNKNLIYKFSNIINDIEEEDLDMNIDYVVKYFLMFGCNMNTIVYEHIKINRWMI
jgi:hypothetical protein